MSSRVHKGWAIAAGTIVVLTLVVYLAGPWALRKLALQKLDGALDEPVALEHLSFNPFTSRARLEGFRIGEGAAPIIDIPGASVDIRWSSLWRSGFHIKTVKLESPHLRLVSPASGPLNVTRLGGGSGGGSSTITIARIEAENGEIEWRDQTAEPEGRIAATGVALLLEGFDSDSDAPMQGRASGTVSGGRLSLEGQFGLGPLTGDLSLSAGSVGLETFNPWLARFSSIELTQGTAGADGQIAFGEASDAPFRYEGALSLAEIEASGANGQRLFSLAQGEVENLDFLLGEHVNLERATLDAPVLTAIVDDDSQFNLTSALEGGSGSSSNESASEEASQSEASSSGGGLTTTFALGRLEVADGRLRFEDRNMSPVVSIDVGSLDGHLEQLVSGSESPATLELEGTVSDGTPVSIQGAFQAVPPEGDMQLQTEQLALEQFAPYVQRFAGYRIESGEADLDLDYQLQNGQLSASNHIVLRRLDLGEQVDESDTSLPLRNLIELLEGDEGVIDIDIPIETSVDGSSSINISAVIWQAISEAFENIITSPIETLGSLIGGEEDGSDEEEASQEEEGAEDGYQGGALDGVRTIPRSQ